MQPLFIFGVQGELRTLNLGYFLLHDDPLSPLCCTPDPVLRHAVSVRRQEAHDFVHALLPRSIIKLGNSAYKLTDLEGVRHQTLLSIQGGWIVEADEQGAEAADTADPIRALTISPLHLFANWPAGNVPRSGAVVYMIWSQESSFIYVGMSGRGFTGRAEGNGKAGSPGRLNSHASGRRSGDQLCVHVVQSAAVEATLSLS